MSALCRRLSAVALWIVVLTGAVAAQAALKAGDRAPEFEMHSLSGEAVSLAALRERGHVLLVFWATECVYCHAMIGDFNALHREYADHGLTLAAINVAGERREEVEAYVKDYALEYLVLHEGANNLDVAEAYQVFGTPTLVVVSPAGEVLYYGHQLPDVKQWLN